MALREFTDGRGVRWLVWSVSSEALHPANRTEAFLQQFSSGWLCFESETGEKRRLVHFPAGWDLLSDDELERLSRSGISGVKPTGSAPRSPGAAGRRVPSEPADEGSDVEAALESAEFEERRRTDRSERGDHPRRRREDRAR